MALRQPLTIIIAIAAFSGLAVLFLRLLWLIARGDTHSDGSGRVTAQAPSSGLTSTQSAAGAPQFPTRVTYIRYRWPPDPGSHGAVIIIAVLLAFIPVVGLIVAPIWLVLGLLGEFFNAWSLKYRLDWPCPHCNAANSIRLDGVAGFHPRRTTVIGLDCPICLNRSIFSMSDSSVRKAPAGGSVQ
jgi:hypothetical protein